MSGPFVFAETPELRLAVLQLAVKFYEDDSVDTDDVIETADVFLEYVRKPE